MQQRTLPTDASGNQKPSAQRNVTDSDSHIVKRGEGWITSGYEGWNRTTGMGADGHQPQQPQAAQGNGAEGLRGNKRG
jgi:hypothetical protein